MVIARLQAALDHIVAQGAVGSLAVYREDDRVWACASGVAQLGSEKPVAPNGWFRIGSLTKAFTATIVLQLVGEGRLRLDDSVEHWLPGLIQGGDAITIGHLARQCSGLHDYAEDMLDGAVILERRLSPHSPHEIVATAARRPRLFPAGQQRSYSNTNYIALGMVIEACTASTYGVELQRRILQPAGMTQTPTDFTDTTLPEPHAHGYLTVGGDPVDITRYSPAWAWSAGGIVSTAEDLNRFYAALLIGALLRPEQLRVMLETEPTGDPSMSLGLGIARMDLPDGSPVWGNAGGFYGFHAWSFHSLDGRRQLSASATTTSLYPPATAELLKAVF